MNLQRQLTAWAVPRVSEVEKPHSSVWHSEALLEEALSAPEQPSLSRLIKEAPQSPSIRPCAPALTSPHPNGLSLHFSAVGIQICNTLALVLPQFFPKRAQEKGLATIRVFGHRYRATGVRAQGSGRARRASPRGRR